MPIRLDLVLQGWFEDLFHPDHEEVEGCESAQRVGQFSTVVSGPERCILETTDLVPDHLFQGRRK